MGHEAAVLAAGVYRMGSASSSGMEDQEHNFDGSGLATRPPVFAKIL